MCALSPSEPLASEPSCYHRAMRAWDRLRAVFEGRGSSSERATDPSETHPTRRARPRELTEAASWISDHPPTPRQPERIIANIRADPAASVGDLTRPAALGTLLEGAMAFALDDAIDSHCEAIEVRLQRDGSAVVEHAGPGYDPTRAIRGCQRWPWLRRSPAGEVMLTRSFAAPARSATGFASRSAAPTASHARPSTAAAPRARSSSVPRSTAA